MHHNTLQQHKIIMKPLLFIIFQFIISTNVAAEIYKCRSNNGPTIYADRPCNPNYSIVLHVHSTPTKLVSETDGHRKPSYNNNQVFTSQERKILNDINHRERAKNKSAIRDQRQQERLTLKQAKQKIKQRSVQKTKCYKYQNRLENYENKASNGYKASEFNQLTINIRRHKKFVATYCK